MLKNNRNKIVIAQISRQSFYCFLTIFIKIFGGDTKSMTVLSVDYQYIKMNNNIKKRHLFRELSHYPLVISF